MKNNSVRPSDDIENVMHIYGNILFRMCLIMLGNASDAEDVVQETMIKYLQKAPKFENAEHKKAWLIKVSVNQCKDILRLRSKHPVINVEEIKEFVKEDSDSEIMEEKILVKK